MRVVEGMDKFQIIKKSNGVPENAKTEFRRKKYRENTNFHKTGHSRLRGGRNIYSAVIS